MRVNQANVHAVPFAAAASKRAMYAESKVRARDDGFAGAYFTWRIIKAQL